MRKVIFTVALTSLFFTCKKVEKKANLNPELHKKEINIILDNWHKAAAEANYENYFNAMDSSSVFIGTDASENWNKSAFSKFSKPYFDKGKAWSFTPLERNIYLDKNQNIVWFDELLKTWMGICRGSGVLEKDAENNWKIKHYVLSVTIPNDNIRQIFNINKVKDSVFLATKYKNIN